MDITIKLDSEQIFNMLRDDIAENLGRDGVNAIIEEVENMFGYYEPVEFDQSIFAEWHRYNNAIEACKELKLDVDAADDEDECFDELEHNYNVIKMSDHSVIVQNF